MLANGAKLGYKETEAASSFINLKGLVSTPDLAREKEKIDITGIGDTTMKYEFSNIVDYGDLEFSFIVQEKSIADTAYPDLLQFDQDNDTLYFQLTLGDGTTVEFAGTIMTTLSGGELNGRQEFTITVALSSDMTFTFPQ